MHLRGPATATACAGRTTRMCGAAHGMLTRPEQDVKRVTFFAHRICESSKFLREGRT